MIKLFAKDLKLFFKDKQSVLLTFLLPIILISLFAFAFGGIGRSSTPNPVKLLITDNDSTATSIKIIAKLDSLDGLKTILVDLEKAREQISRGNYAGVLIFHKGFEDSVNAGTKMPLELLYDKAQEMKIGMLQPVLISTLMSSVGKQTITKNIERYLNSNFPNINKDIRDKIFSDAVTGSGNNIGLDLDSDIKMTSIVGERKETNLGLIQAVAGTSILMLLFSVAALGTSILEEKGNGTLNRLIYSPLKANTILFSKMLFTYCIALLQLCIMFLFSWLVFGLDIFVNIPALILMIAAVAFAVTGFGIFLAAVAKTRHQAQSLSTLVILIMSAIGGSMIPLFIMPSIMRKIAVLSVNYWGIQGFYDIFWRELSLVDILPRVLVLAGIGAVMTLISIKLFKKNIMELL